MLPLTPLLYVPHVGIWLFVACLAFLFGRIALVFPSAVVTPLELMPVSSSILKVLRMLPSVVIAVFCSASLTVAYQIVVDDEKVRG